jgi:dsRNA-specific ribonuclease
MKSRTLQKICDGLKENNYERLDLSYKELSAGQVKQILAALETNVSLQQLDLSYNQLGDATLIRLVQTLSNVRHPLSTLNLSGNLLSAEGVAELSSAVETNQHLVTVEMANNPGIKRQSPIAIDDGSRTGSYLARNHASLGTTSHKPPVLNNQVEETKAKGKEIASAPMPIRRGDIIGDLSSSDRNIYASSSSSSHAGPSTTARAPTANLSSVPAVNIVADSKAAIDHESKLPMGAYSPQGASSWSGEDTSSFMEEMEDLMPWLPHAPAALKAKIFPGCYPSNEAGQDKTVAAKTTVVSFEPRDSKALILNYVFTDASLLEQALTRKTALIEGNRSATASDRVANERLELLGDSIVRTVIDDILMELHLDWSTAQLSQARDVLVSKKGFLYEAAVRLELHKFAKMDKNERSLCVGEGRYTIFSSLMEAIIGAVFIDCKRDYACIKRFIAEHAGFSKKPEYRNFRLFEAVKNRDIEEMDYWLAQGADPNAWYNCMVEDPRPRPLILLNDTTPLSRFDVLYTHTEANALTLAFRRLDGIDEDTPRMVEALLKHGAHPSRGARISLASLLYETIVYDKRSPSHVCFKLTQVLCKYGADPNERSYQSGAIKFTAFEMAIFEGDEKTVRLLLAHGAKPYLRGPKKRTALHWAVLYADFHYQQEISARRSGSAATSFFKHHQPRWLKYQSIIQLLIAANASITATDEDGKQPISFTQQPVLRALLTPLSYQADAGEEFADSKETPNCILS